MIRPTPILTVLFGFSGILALIFVLNNPASGPALVWVFLMILFMAGVDVFLNKQPVQAEIVFQTQKRSMVGVPSFLEIFIDFKGSGARPKTLATVELGDLFRSLEKPVFEVGAEGVRIPLVASRRGIGEIYLIRAKWFGPFRLTTREKEVKCNLKLPVIPDTNAVEIEALTFNEREAVSGVKPQRLQGEGTEFEALREFVAGLDPRTIDWKHSARHHNLLCKQYEVERNHQVILAFDAGHLMSGEIDGLSKIDHAINSSLVLAYRTLRAGDKVGYFAFDSGIKDYFAPAGGGKTLSVIRDRLAGLDYSADETNFTLGLTTLLSKLNRRSLIIFFTDFVDTITSEIMIENLQRLSRHHLILFVTFREKLLVNLFGKQPESFQDVTRAVVAKQFINERNVLLTRLSRLGIQYLEAPSSDLAAGLVSRYLFIKGRGMI